MKPARIEKLEQQLTVSECALKSQLLELLPGALAGNTLLFINSEFNSLGLRPHSLKSNSEELLSKSKECIQLRESLAMPIENSPGYLYISACKESASTDENRRGPRRLAEWLLGELRNAS